MRLLCVRRIALIGAAAALLWPIAGCGGARQRPLAPVSGLVTLHGKPVPNMNVIFQPMVGKGNQGETGFGSSGTTDNDGKFTLKTVDGKPGAVVGTHHVWLMVRNDTPASAAQNDMPQRGPPNPLPYEAFNGSLTFEVPPEGTDQATFAY